MVEGRNSTFYLLPSTFISGFPPLQICQKQMLYVGHLLTLLLDLVLPNVHNAFPLSTISTCLHHKSDLYKPPKFVLSLHHFSMQVETWNTRAIFQNSNLKDQKYKLIIIYKSSKNHKIIFQQFLRNPLVPLPLG